MLTLAAQITLQAQGGSNLLALRGERGAVETMPPVVPDALKLAIQPRMTPKSRPPPPRFYLPGARATVVYHMPGCNLLLPLHISWQHFPYYTEEIMGDSSTLMERVSNATFPDQKALLSHFTSDLCPDQ